METPSFWLSIGPLLVVNFFTITMLIIFAIISRKWPKNVEIEDRHSSMILGRWIREFWFWLTNPIFKFFIYFKISPNAISIMGTVVALLSGFCFAFGHIGLAGWVMVLGASLDFFDGRVARTLNRVTLAGSYIDSCMDRISEGLTMAGIVYLYRDSYIFWVAMAAFIGSQITSYTKAKGENMGVEYAGGMMQRPERIAYMGGGAIVAPMIAYFIYPLIGGKFPNISYLDLVGYVYMLPLIFVAFFSILASLNRIVKIMKLLDKKEFGSKD